MPDIQLIISFRVIGVLFIAVCSVLLSAFIYRYTVPPISKYIKSILIGLRSIGIFLLILLLGEPLLLLITHSTDQPRVVVLIDDSKSMSIRDKNGNRSNLLKSIIKSDIWNKLNKAGKIIYSRFDKNVYDLSGVIEDSLKQKGEATDISKALKLVKQKYGNTNLQAVMIITDGNSTEGTNPLYEAEELAVPIFTVGIGDTSEQKDLLIRKVLSNEIVYAGTKTMVNIVLHSVGYGGEKVNVFLRDGSSTLDEKNIVLERGSLDYPVTLSLIPEKEGMQKYSVEVAPFSDELTTQNNRMNFFVKVLKSKMKVVLIANAPNPDVASVRRILENNKNLNVTTYIEHKDGQFYGGALTPQLLNETDCMLLIGFPTAQSSSRNIRIIMDALEAGKPFFLMLSRSVDFAKLQSLQTVLPFRFDNIMGSEIQTLTNVPESQRNNPILKITANENTTDAWSKLPPTFSLQGNYRSKIEAEILVTVRHQTSQTYAPFIISRNVDKMKSIAVLGYGLWRWNMLSEAESGSAQVLESFLNNSIRWLTTQEDSRRIRIQPAKQIFTSQDEVEFIAQLYDENYQPINNAQVEVSSKRGNDSIPLTLNLLGNGQYLGSYERLMEGDYKFTSTVRVNGTLVGRDEGNFSVGGLNAEFLETRMNKTLLQQIAAQTGGKYFNADEVNLIADDIISLPNFKPQEVSKSAEIELWNSRWMILLIITAFTVEWFLRKRNGML